MPDPTEESLRRLLCQLGSHIRDELQSAAAAHSAEELSRVAHESDADTIYAIDRLSESAIRAWLSANWPTGEPVRLIMEGIPDCEAVCFPHGAAPESCKWVLIVDPIDGTRGIMYGKRSAWALLGLAPQTKGGLLPRLSDIRICCMTELPPRKAAFSDQLSCVHGTGLHAQSLHLESGKWHPLAIRPSRARDFRHGFASLVKFFPEGRAFTAMVEEELWRRLGSFGKDASPVIFDDQYISTGGQFYEVLVGHDRLIADLRPDIFRAIGLENSLVCHPYDACCWPLLAEAGAVFCALDGTFPDAPLDTTSPVSWVAVANPELAEIALPHLRLAFDAAAARFSGK